jgi:hypothetical protein
LGAAAGNAAAMDNADNAKSESRIGRLGFRSVRPKMSCIRICKPRMALAVTRETISKKVAGEARMVRDCKMEPAWNAGTKVLKACKNRIQRYPTPLATAKCS